MLTHRYYMLSHTFPIDAQEMDMTTTWLTAESARHG